MLNITVATIYSNMNNLKQMIIINNGLKKMLTESCVMFFSPSRYVLCAILGDDYLTSVVRTKQEDKACSNQRPARDLVHFRLELTPNQWNSHLKNTSIRSTRDVSMSDPSESSVLPKFLKKSDPKVARPAFST